jgi:RNA polymerase sigma-70 factor, ECF subfamily
MEDMAPTSRPGTIQDEATLLARMQAGEGDAFEACVRTHCTRMLVVARRILRNDEDARDAVQEAFLAAFKQIGHFQGLSRLGTWLHRIVVNAALNRLRSRRRHPEQSIEDLLPHFGAGEHQLDPPAPWKDTADTLLRQQETRALVRQCISQLPETYRTVLLLRDIEGLDTDETARMLGTSPGVVKTRLHRARQALRTLLEPEFCGGEPC